MRPRGAIPTPRHKLAGAIPHEVVGPTPAEWLWNPVAMAMWGNDRFGDCVTAEEAFTKAVSGVFIPTHKIVHWARKNFVLNGAGLWEVMELMLQEGIDHDGSTYHDGGFIAVDWTNDALLRNAISKGPVKLGVAAEQLDNVVPNPPTNGWIATGFAVDGNLDHCISAAGYGPMSWCAQQLGVTLAGHINDPSPAYIVFTWSSLGIIDPASLKAITGEAWLRIPSTVTVVDPA